MPPCDIAANSKHKWQTLSLQNPEDPKIYLFLLLFPNFKLAIRVQVPKRSAIKECPSLGEEKKKQPAIQIKKGVLPKYGVIN